MLAVCWDNICTHVHSACSAKANDKTCSMQKTGYSTNNASYFPAASLKQKKYMQLLLFYSIPLSTLFLPLSPPLPSSSPNDSHAPPPPCVSYVFHPFSSHLPVPLSLLSHSPTSAHFLHQQASNTLQVTLKKIDLFLHSLHPSSLFLICVFSPSSSLHWSMYSQSLTETAQKLNWLVVRNRLTVDS